VRRSAALLCALWLVAAPARAYHTRQSPIITDNAHTLGRRVWNVGLWRADYGLHDAITIGTYHWAWFFGFANLGLKARLFSNERWALSLAPSMIRVDLAKLSKAGADSHAVLWVVPSELSVSRTFKERYVVSSALVYTYVWATGSYDPSDAHGVLALSNMQLTGTFEWRATRSVALLAHVRTLLFQQLGASVKSQTQLDAYTTAEVEASGQSSALDIKHGSSLMLSTVLSMKRFNLRGGLGYGNWSLPAANLVVPRKTPIFEVDLYFRFGGGASEPPPAPAAAPAAAPAPAPVAQPEPAK
jgi:hypothetical protein